MMNLISGRPRAHPAVRAATRSATSIGPQTTARTLVAGTRHVRERTRLVDDARARLPFFCSDLLHHLDLEVAFGDQLLQPRVLSLKPLKPAYIVGLERSETLPPRVDRLLADPMPLGDHADRLSIRFSQDRHYLLVREP